MDEARLPKQVQKYIPGGSWSKGRLRKKLTDTPDFLANSTPGHFYQKEKRFNAIQIYKNLTSGLSPNSILTF